MKIAVVCDVYGRENNGSAVVTYNLIRFLKEQGHEVRILCADQGSKGKPDHYVVPNMSFGKYLNAYVAKVGVSIAKPDKRIIKAALMGVDAVHIMMPMPLGLSTVKIAKKMGLPITAVIRPFLHPSQHHPDEPNARDLRPAFHLFFYYKSLYRRKEHCPFVR